VRPDDAIDAALDLLRVSAGMPYIGEPISQLEHALQCAHLAVLAGADDTLVAAALLHDAGHLCAPAEAPRMGGLGVFAHERVGAEHLLALGFPERVAALVEGHVAAKRYLVSRTPGYEGKLSKASTATLRHQGGPMREEEAGAFERDPLFKDKLRLRAWDEQAKRVGWKVPELERYRDLLRRVAGPPAPAAAADQRSGFARKRARRISAKPK
jgi:predicted HD phosphohydrolase